MIAITAVYQRTALKYGARAERYAALEAGHAAENILLEAVALDLRAVPVGAFDDDPVREVLALPRHHRPLYLLAVGHHADDHDVGAATAESGHRERSPATRQAAGSSAAAR